jgi:beta-lactamase family protein
VSEAPLPNAAPRGLVLLLLAATGCIRLTGPASALRPLPRDSTLVWNACNAPPCRGEVRFTYLGVGGFLIRSGGDALLTAPSFTHPGLLAVATPHWPIHTDSAIVDLELHRLLGPDLRLLDSVQAILVGHAHYDHLMDVPLLARRYARNARIYGTLTTKRTLMGDSSMRAQAGRIDSLSPFDSVVATAWHVGRWIYTPTRRMRFMAVRSSHARNWWFVTLAPCHEHRDRATLPRTGWGWCLGEPVSYLIDVLDDSGRPVFRIFYQDAAARPLDVVLPPFTGTDQHAVDVAIVCAGNFKKVEEYPTMLLAAIRPSFVIVGHWEDFFHAQSDAPTPVRLTDTRELADRLDLLGPRRWRAPMPGARITVRY